MTKQKEIFCVCNKCGKEKPLTEFYKSKMNRSGYRWQCKDCLNARSRDNYGKSGMKAHRVGDYDKTDMARYTRLKSNAKKRNTEFSLDKLEFLIWFREREKICHYCSISLNLDGNRAEQLSIDRKDNRKGYTLNNIVLCCQQCNTIKGNIFTEQEMIEIAERYLKPKMEVYRDSPGAGRADNHNHDQSGADAQGERERGKETSNTRTNNQPIP